MRIRSIKPEFWRSDDITQLNREDRLLFIGLWSYVDDNGVGLDDYRAIAADLFALEDDQKDIRDFVREGLATLSRVLLVSRYMINTRRYIYINSWDRHQRVDRPNKERFPRPPDDWKPPTSGDAELGAPKDPDSRHPRDTLASLATKGASGTGEQGNRGTEEQGIKTASRRSPAGPTPTPAGTQLEVLPGGQLDPTTATSHDAVGAWVDSYRAQHDAEPTKRQIGQAAREIKALLDAGNPPPRVLHAAKTAGSHGFATIEREYRDLSARNPDTRHTPRPSTTDSRVGAALALAEQYAQEP